MKAESRTAILVPPGPNRRWTRSAYAKHTKMAAAIGLTGRTRIGAPRESETDDDGDGPGPRRQWQRQRIEGLVEGIGRPAAVRRSFQFLLAALGEELPPRDGDDDTARDAKDRYRNAVEA